jgi:acyl-CoA synthetase
MNNTTLTLLSRDRIAETYASGHWRDDTLFSLVQAHAARHPDRAAVRSRVAALTYAELMQRASALAADLAEAGVRPGQRVAVWLSSRIETAIALVACSRNGYVCCPSLHRDHTVADIVELCQRMRAAAFIGEIGYGADAARRDIFQALEGVETLRRVHRVGAVGSDPSDALPKTLDGAAAGPAKTDPNLVLYLAFTSGTTGRPKGVMHSDNTLLANARALIADWHFGPESVIYTMSPLSHNLGLGSLVMALAAGGQLVVHDLARGASLLDRLTEVGATFLVGVPTHAIDLLNELKSRGSTAPGTLKGFRISGASAPREVVAELLRYGVVPQSGYGMTEAGSHHYTLPTDGPDRIVGTSGRSCDGYEIRIWSKDNPEIELPVGEVGQIGGRGASLMLGYFDDQAANEAAFNASGWFMTGDLGRLDEDGYLQITGRKKDLIIRGGHNIYPARIENLAMQHAAVARAAVMPVPDARLGEKVCLVVMFRPGQRAEVQDLLEHLDRSGLSRYDMPEYYLEVDEIPLTASGKILKRDLAAQLMNGQIEPVPVRWQGAAAPARS